MLELVKARYALDPTAFVTDEFRFDVPENTSQYTELFVVRNIPTEHA
jgi:hypothetical protein